MTALSAVSPDVVRQLPGIPARSPVLIAGPTASGKSALALHIAATSGGTIINADALQVFDGWRLLTARPSDAELNVAEHLLYGHVPLNASYSVGNWLREIEPLLIGQRPIIVGGTGLYFAALTKGLAPIPTTPDEVRVEADQLSLPQLLLDLDEATKARIDTRNRARVQRAWEVLTATGRSIADWQANTPAPLLVRSDCVPLVLQPDPDWLNRRIEARFDMMLDQGALAEAKSLQRQWNPKSLSSKAIGASELMAHLNGELTLGQAREAAIIASRQYGKRQRTWFRSQMGDWSKILLGS